MDLTLPQARLKVAKHRQAFPNATRSVAFTLQNILDIIAQPDCVEIEICHALEDADQPDNRTMILTGVDSEGTMLPLLKGGTWTCPPNCSEGGLGS